MGNIRVEGLAARPAEYADMPSAEYSESAKRNIENINFLRRDHESSGAGSSMAIIGVGYVAAYFHLGKLIGIMDWRNTINGHPVGYVLEKTAMSEHPAPVRLLTRWLSDKGAASPWKINSLDETIESMKKDMARPYRAMDKFVIKEVSAAELQEIGWQFIKDNVAAALTNPAEAVTLTAPSTKEN